MTKENSGNKTDGDNIAENNKKEPPDHKGNIGATSALLDFYSDRATSFASLMVASVFGIVTLAAIIQVIDNNPIIKGISLFPYIAFSYAGYYTWGRFLSWATRADKIERHCVRLPSKSYLEKVEFLRREGSEELTNMNDFLTNEAETPDNLIVRKTRKIVTRKYVFEIGYFAVIVTLAVVTYLG